MGCRKRVESRTSILRGSPCAAELPKLSGGTSATVAGMLDRRQSGGRGRAAAAAAGDPAAAAAAASEGVPEQAPPAAPRAVLEPRPHHQPRCQRRRGPAELRFCTAHRALIASPAPCATSTPATLPWRPISVRPASRLREATLPQLATQESVVFSPEEPLPQPDLLRKPFEKCGRVHRHPRRLNRFRSDETEPRGGRTAHTSVNLSSTNAASSIGPRPTPPANAVRPRTVFQKDSAIAPPPSAWGRRRGACRSSGAGT